jgi:hypothetical protein
MDRFKSLCKLSGKLSGLYVLTVKLYLDLQASGVQKVPLVEGHEVYLSRYQLHTVQEQRTQRKEIGRLLDVFFSKTDCFRRQLCPWKEEDQ